MRRKAPRRDGGNDRRTDIGRWRRAKGHDSLWGGGCSARVCRRTLMNTAKVFGRDGRLIESAFLPLHAIRRTGKFETTTIHYRNDDYMARMWGRSVVRPRPGALVKRVETLYTRKKSTNFLRDNKYLKTIPGRHKRRRPVRVTRGFTRH